MDAPAALAIADSARSSTSTVVDVIDWVALIANIGSLAGFLVTMYTLYKVWQLRRHYTFMARAPELQKKLETQADNLRDQFLGREKGKPDRISIEEAVTFVQRSLSHLDGLIAKMERAERHEMRELRRELRSSVSGSNLKTSDLWSAYGILNRVIERADDIKESRTWTLTP